MRSWGVLAWGCRGAELGAVGLLWGRAELSSCRLVLRAAPMGWEARGAHPRGWEQAGICVLGRAIARVRGGYSRCFIIIVVTIIY